VEIEPLVVGRERRTYTSLVVAWVLVNLLFWIWWLQPGRIETTWLYVLFTAAFAYDVTFVPSMYLLFVRRLSRPVPIPAPEDLKVALITLCVPRAEALDVIVREMEALVRVRYPHDSWILDEGNSPEVRGAAERLGVRYFTREGMNRYNRSGPPFQAKTKAGNVNAWLDAHGHSYDFFVQFDVDHEPARNYLDHVLGFFADSRVAWVQAPSIYGNLENWVSRGAAEQELILQGPLQQGFFGTCGTPFIIGSHCTYRMSAIREIGGFQPTRAEDHLDTVVLAGRGYQGVYTPEVIAIGRGPDTFETYLRQQFAWALSLMQVLIHHSPQLLWRHRPMQVIQFLFAQSWYMLWSTSLFILAVLPLLVLLTGQRPANTPFGVFVVQCLPIALATTAIWSWTRRWEVHRGVRLSWRGVILQVARWPIVFWALVNLILGVKHPYMITPKGVQTSLPQFALQNQAIYLIGVWLTCGVVGWTLWQSGTAGSVDAVGYLPDHLKGFLLLALWGAVFPLAVLSTNVAADLRELSHRVSFPSMIRLRLVPLSTMLVTGALVGFVGTASAERVLSTPARTTPVVEADHATVLTSTSTELAPGPLPMELPTDSDSIIVGAYDPRNELVYEPLALEHHFLRQDQPDSLAAALERARNVRVVMVTLEPFPADGQTTSALEAVGHGDKDEEIRAVARVVASANPQIVLIRWGHEMELIGLYPWSIDDPALYRAAFRHAVQVFRETGAWNARWVWSPAGESSAASYYPGADVVDYVGLTVLGSEEWDRAQGLAPRSFSELLESRYEVVAPFLKPVIIPELGVSGPPERQKEWLLDAATALPAFPLVRAVSYFDEVNAPNTWVETLPDWRVSPTSLAEFVSRVASPR
jgi:cellulose synthase (UDP-forming)